MVCYMDATDIWALPFQTHRRRKAAEQRELSAEHYRACWELLSVAPWKGLPGVDGKSMGRHRRNSVWYWNRSLVHLLRKEVGRGERWCDSTIWLKQKPFSQNEPIITLRNTRMFHIKSQKAHFWRWQTCSLTRQQIMFDKCQNFVTHQAVLLPGRVDPPWWGSAGAGEQQGEACVVLCWCGCIVWSHLKEPVDDVGRKADDGSSHPGPGNCAVQVCLVSPTGVSLVGCYIVQKKYWYRHREFNTFCPLTDY